MSNWCLALVMSFCQIAKDLHAEYVESWLQGKVKDYDMDMVLIDEKKRRSYTYKKLVNALGGK